MNASQTIREAVARVAQLQQTARQNPALQGALTTLKAFQAQRFSATYADLLASAAYGEAARFFLLELYSERDYAQRDAQFARIAGALQRLFPRPVVATAVALAELHQRTEELDFAMAQAWLQMGPTQDASARYVQCWRSVGQSAQRRRQLDQVLSIGGDLERLTRTPGVRRLLHVMRRPAAAAGLSALQRFLEAGFDTFAALATSDARTAVFLETIAARESALMDRLFDAREATPLVPV